MGMIFGSMLVLAIAIVGFIYFVIQDRKEKHKTQ